MSEPFQFCGGGKKRKLFKTIKRSTAGNYALSLIIIFFLQIALKSGILKKEEMIRKHAGDRLSSSRNGFLSYTLLFYIFHRYYFTQITLH